ncbi:MAG: hypothetical protein ACJZ9F_10035 [Rhodospirillaceae bacterium]
MIFTTIYTDDHGHSYFGEVDLPQTGNERRVSAKAQDVDYWRVSRTLPGHYVDFKTVESAQMVSVLSGRIELTVSNGEKRYLSRGDMIILKDTLGQGHCTRVLGFEPCESLIIGMPEDGEFRS